ncbi:MAG TPA: riboflavin kinase, partial [archaeon]|nr:riboflavin kinase [archaeon]
LILMKIISGKVIKGARRGKKLGFPTANLRFSGRLSGIYAVYIYIDGKKYGGAANIGYAPTFGPRGKLLEVFIFRFNKNIVGKKIDVEIVKKLRDEKKFDSVSALVKQIRKDVKKAKILLN